MSFHSFSFVFCLMKVFGTGKIRKTEDGRYGQTEDESSTETERERERERERE